MAIDELKMHGVPGGFQLKPGMTVRADIKAGERTLPTYLFARVMPVGREGMRDLSASGRAQLSLVDRLFDCAG